MICLIRRTIVGLLMYVLLLPEAGLPVTINFVGASRGGIAGLYLAQERRRRRRNRNFAINTVPVQWRLGGGMGLGQ